MGLFSNVIKKVSGVVSSVTGTVSSAKRLVVSDAKTLIGQAMQTAANTALPAAASNEMKRRVGLMKQLGTIRSRLNTQAKETELFTLLKKLFPNPPAPITRLTGQAARDAVSAYFTSNSIDMNLIKQTAQSLGLSCSVTFGVSAGAALGAGIDGGYGFAWNPTNNDLRTYWYSAIGGSLPFVLPSEIDAAACIEIGFYAPDPTQLDGQYLSFKGTLYDEVGGQGEFIVDTNGEVGGVIGGGVGFGGGVGVYVGHMITAAV